MTCNRCEDTRLIQVIKHGNPIEVPCPACWERGQRILLFKAIRPRD